MKVKEENSGINISSSKKNMLDLGSFEVVSSLLFDISSHVLSNEKNMRSYEVK